MAVVREPAYPIAEPPLSGSIAGGDGFIARHDHPPASRVSYDTA